MRRVQQLESALVRIESGIVVVLVLVMLLLAVYNVVYRNVLASLQRQLATSGPPVVVAEPPLAVQPARAAPRPDDIDGFGGGLAAAGEGTDEADGFGGGLAAAGGGTDEAGGFGGGLAEEGEGTDEAGGFAGGLAEEGEGKKAEVAVPAEPTGQQRPPEPSDTRPEGGPPPPGSVAAGVVALIDAIKLEWIDVFLRQLVLIVSFFGAMLATHRCKHINIDAVGAILPAKLRRPVAIATNVLAVLICIVLAVAGLDLVELSLQYPKDLVPWAREWVFQLVFPLGFGLLALHFGARLAEAIADPKAEKAGAR